MKVYLYSLIVNISNGLTIVFFGCICIYLMMYRYSYPQKSLIEMIMMFSFISLIFIPNSRELALMMNIKELIIKRRIGSITRY